MYYYYYYFLIYIRSVAKRGWDTAARQPWLFIKAYHLLDLGSAPRFLSLHHESLKEMTFSLWNTSALYRAPHLQKMTRRNRMALGRRRCERIGCWPVRDAMSGISFRSSKISQPVMLAQAELPKMGCYLKTERGRTCVLDSEQISTGETFLNRWLFNLRLFT